MKVFDLIFLKEGIFQLEERHGKWNTDQCETAVIVFAGFEAKLDPIEFGNDQEVLCVVSQLVV